MGRRCARTVAEADRRDRQDRENGRIGIDANQCQAIQCAAHPSSCNITSSASRFAVALTLALAVGIDGASRRQDDRERHQGGRDRREPSQREHLAKAFVRASR